MNAHFFDITTAIQSNSKVWIISKMNPNYPVIKLTESDFNLIKKGIFRGNGYELSINNKKYWLPEELSDEIKIKCKKLNIEPKDLTFSMKEFMSPEIIDNLEYKIWKEHFLNLKNTNDDIYIICSKNTKNSYKTQIEKFENFLLELGLKVKDYYYLSETFYNRDEDEIAYKKSILLLEHLIGLKIEDNKFINQETTQYDNISYYDDERKSISLSKRINDVLKVINDNSEDLIKSQIKSKLDNTKSLYVNEVTFNKANLFIQTEVEIKIERIIKTFEGFINKF